MVYKLKTAETYFPDFAERKRLVQIGFKFQRTQRGFKIENTPTIEINSLEALNALVKLYGEIILSEDEIIIYNGYVE